MVTKLRKFLTDIRTKTVGFILTVVLITSVIVQMAYVSYLDIDPECIFVKDYKQSENYRDYINGSIDQVVLIDQGIMFGQRDLEYAEFDYYYSDGKQAFTNADTSLKSYYKQFDNYYAFENGKWSYGKGTNPNIRVYWQLDKDHSVYVVFPNNIIEQKEQEWQDNRVASAPFVVLITLCTVFSLALIIYLLLVTGRKPEDKELHLSKLDRIYSDILLLSGLAVLAYWINEVSQIYSSYMHSGRVNYIFSIIVIGILTAIITSVCGAVLLSLARKFKADILLKHSLLYTLISKIYHYTSTFLIYIFNGKMYEKYPLTKTLFYRQLSFIISSAVIVFFTLLFALMNSPLFLFLPLLELVIIYWYIKGNKMLYEDINKGFNESWEEQMKSERMKVALITNVSHDLKTPLTSIISYVDLLSKEEGLSDTASDYVKILQDKSNRLKSIVTDLFDLAKSNSGAITLDLETIDIKKLIEQTLGDMEDKIEASGLTIKQKLPDNPVMVHSDGKRLYRIFQNVIDNALKYSLQGTRIFVELEDTQGSAVAVIKNIAGYDMDFTAEEVLQRFIRGDKSRTTEGSGLGLSIAESFTRVCGGDFKVDIDGDMFKVTIKFNLVN